MPARTLASVLQLVIGVSLLNVWLLRAGNSTAYRGGSAQSLKQEFAEYGLPAAMFYIVGALKVISGVILLAGLWLRLPVAFAAMVVAALMIGAIAMHTRMKDPLRKSVPAAALLAMCAALLLVR
jgi:uncharacterized membrane protein YphA (DoxX/SURF4 family)